ncbi:NAD(+) diphosphatase [Tessaracoccus antarcticus]|uniref:NAD(+) diphosphatase n=1 Tax=Tessaracoccus antarcticus TaxID=2479848 RepID=A0A3M0G5B6_9ACTN|nr:NAD(+) diphosphatase [Tessaracoccus antarcticus]RMB60065.1 NAD(+) diphosphatase [Tessaracoccus antarcticus]
MNHWMGKSALERNVGVRGDADLDAAWQDAFVLEVDDQGRFSAVGSLPVELSPRDGRRASDILLGSFDGRPWFARPVLEIEQGDSATWREVDDPWQAPVASAVALVRWHAMTPHCERCGAATVPDAGGVRRVCPSCGLMVFPRQDPAIIVAVLDPDDRLLLASHSAWPSERMSIIAGFVEAGESLEQACFREVSEEVGLALDSVAYVSSQPWPMPRSLMLGFVATTRDLTVHPDGDEIAWGRFWSRSELQQALAEGEVKLPGSTSIARQLIEGWLVGTLPRPD